MTNIVSLVQEVELSNGWFASQQSDGTLIIHNFPTSVSDMEADSMELVELHLASEEQSNLFKLLQASLRESFSAEPLPRYVASKCLHGDVWLFLDEAGSLTLKDGESIMVLSNIAARGLLNFCHKQAVQDTIRLTDSTIA